MKKVRQLLQETSEHSWIATYSVLNEWARSCVGAEADVTGVLLQCTDARDDGLRILAVQQLSEMGWSSSGRRTEIVPVLLKRIRDRNGRVLSIVYEHLPRVIKACTQEDHAVVDALIAACSTTGSVEKRVIAFEMLRLASRRFPERVDDIITAVIRGCKDGHPEVRRQAIDQVSELARARPERAPEIQDMLCWVLTNCDCATYLRASSELEKTVEVIPDKAEEIAGKLFEMYDCEYGYVSLSMVKILARLVHLRPERLDMVVESLMVWLQNGNSSSQGEALGPLVDLMKHCPTRRIEFAEAVLRRLGCGGYTNRAEYNLQSAALRLAPKAAKGCPERANEIVTVLTIVTRGWNDHHRGLALQALVELIATDLERIDVVVDALIHACTNSDERIRAHAVDQISSAMESYSDIARDIIGAIFECFRDGAEDSKSAFIPRLASAARSSPERAEEIVQVLIRFSTCTNAVKRARAMDGLAQTVSVCPKKSDLIFARLLYGCADCYPQVRNAAKESLEMALPLRPDIAVKILERMIDHCSEEEDVTGELKKSESLLE